MVIIIGIAIILIAGSALFYLKNKEQTATTTATTYEDAGGWVYQCSQPIRVKDQGVRYMSGKPSLTPIDQAEADKYCQRIGIE